MSIVDLSFPTFNSFQSNYFRHQEICSTRLGDSVRIVGKPEIDHKRRSRKSQRRATRSYLPPSGLQANFRVSHDRLAIPLAMINIGLWPMISPVFWRTSTRMAALLEMKRCAVNVSIWRERLVRSQSAKTSTYDFVSGQKGSLSPSPLTRHENGLRATTTASQHIPLQKQVYTHDHRKRKHRQNRCDENCSKASQWRKKATCASFLMRVTNHHVL